MTNRIYYLTLLTAMLTSCASQKQKAVDATTSATTLMEQNNEKMNEYDEANFVTAEKINGFGLDLFARLNANAGDEAIVSSPLGVTYVLSMLDNGANGIGKKEIEQALGMDANAINDLSQKMIANGEEQKSSAVFSIANYLALNKDFSLKQNYKKQMLKYYQAGVDNLDFSSPVALQTINDWCSKNTGGMIPKFLDAVDVGARAYVLNALYFNGEWKKKFKVENTRQETFTNERGEGRMVMMMHQETKFDYAQNDTVQLLVMPYGEGDYEMIVALPRSGKTVLDAINYLKKQSVGSLNRITEQYRVDTYLPKFTTETKTDLNATLQSLGINAIYKDGSALSGISGESVLVSTILQKAKIEVGEKGTKAAAVTGAMLLTSALPQPVPTATFRADHPFVYMIVDNRSGVILFVGAYK